MTSGIFITATGTDTGKTFTCSLLLKKMIETDLNCGYYKPVLSGAEETDGKLIPGDCDYVLRTANLNYNPCDYVSYIFKPAVSPHLAAEMENNPIRLEKIKNDFEIIKQKFDYIIVEGAGGIVCPFNLTDKKLMICDVIKALGLDIIIVAHAGLGTINSTVLTAKYAEMQGVKVKGIILNNFNKNDIMHIDNKKQIEKLTGHKVIAQISQNAHSIETEDIKSIFGEIKK